MISIPALAAALAFAAAANVPSPTAQTEQAAVAALVGHELGLAHHERLRLDLPADAVERFEVELTLGGRAHTAVLRRHSLRARGFQLLVQGADGRLRAAEPPPVGTYRGTVRGVPGADVRAARVDGRWRLHVALEDGAWQVEPLALLGPGAFPDEYVAYRTADVVSSGGTCGGALGAELEVPSPGGQTAPGPAAPNTVQITELAVDADFEFFQLNGSSVANTVADIEAVLNDVDVIYRRDVDITHLLTAMVVRTTSADPYSEFDPALLLDEMRVHWNSQMAGVPRDLAHLFTGKNLHGNTVGYAWLSVTCSSPSNGFGYALSQSRYSPNAWERTALTAHELGHNWSACHCNQSTGSCPPISFPCRIMCSIIQGCDLDVTGFNGSSIFQIVSFRNTRSCLGPRNGVLFVDAGAAAGLESGLDWANAFTDLNDALAVANDGEEVWVATGTYRPDPGGSDRGATFVLPFGVGVYGGFAGTETQRSQRDPAANPTVLSGVLVGGARSYHVVTADGLDTTAVLDGFTITGGVASGGTPLDTVGAGLTVDGGGPLVRGCVFTANAATDGAAVYVEITSTPRFERCRFVDNAALDRGGAVLHRGGGTTTFLRCVFQGNTARYGGALYAWQAPLLVSDSLFYDNLAVDPGGGSSFGGAVLSEIATTDGPTLLGCTLVENTASGGTGGGIWAFKQGFTGTGLTMANSILWGNMHAGPASGAQLTVGAGAASAFHLDHNCVQDGLGVLGGTGNIASDPLFVNAAADNFRLPLASPCIDAGTNVAVPAGHTRDLENKARIFDGDGDFQAVVDMGCYELGPSPVAWTPFP